LSEWKEKGSKVNHGKMDLIRLKRIGRKGNKKLLCSSQKPEGMEKIFTGS
jgi:hypothetical protein